MRIILTCGCANTTDYAKSAFKILFPNDELPQVIEYKTDDPYAYFISVEKYNDTEKVEVYNLMKGYKIC